MKKIYNVQMKPHLEKAFNDHAGGRLYVPKRTAVKEECKTPRATIQVTFGKRNPFMRISEVVAIEIDKHIEPDCSIIYVRTQIG